jgi:ATP-binding cassette subfamily B multidrug efflux pump
MASLRLLLPYLYQYRPALLWGLVWLLATDLLGLMLPWMLKQGIDAVQQGSYRLLVVASALLAGAALIRFGTRLLSRFAFLRTACRIEVDLRRDLLSRLLSRDASFFDRHRTGDLLSRFTNDLSNIRTMAGFGLLILINTLLVYGLTLGVLLSLSPSLTLVALLPYPLLLLLVKLLSARLLVASGKVQRGLGRVSEILEEGIAGQEVIRSYGLFGFYGKKFARENDSYLESSLVLSRLRALVGPAMALIAPFATLLILYYGGQRVVAGRLSLGELVAFNAYLMQLAMPTLMLGWVLSLAQRAAASIERLIGLLEQPPAAVTDALRPAEGPPAVEIAHLSFAYDDGKAPVLHDLNLTAAPGALVGITGGAGSGKSTLLRLLAGLYPVGSGQIRVAGQDLSRLDMAAHRNRLAMVPQEGRLFSGTLRENLLYGVPEAEEELLRQVTSVVSLESEIAGFSDGANTRVGEGGKALSGGQRQRVCLGRALARGGSLWLLDDPFSHLDAGTAREVWQALQPLLRQNTAFLVAGRASLLAAADWIVVLERGRLVEQGRYAELLARGGRFARMAEREKLQQELEALA